MILKSFYVLLLFLLQFLNCKSQEIIMQSNYILKSFIREKKIRYMSLFYITNDSTKREYYTVYQKNYFSKKMTIENICEVIDNPRKEYISDTIYTVYKGLDLKYKNVKINDCWKSLLYGDNDVNVYLEKIITDSVYANLYVKKCLVYKIEHISICCDHLDLRIFLDIKRKIILKKQYYDGRFLIGEENLIHLYRKED